LSANNVARWNGTSWSALGAGMDSTVNALAVLPNGDLVAGGNFLNAGGTIANNIARWNSTSWSALGAGMDSTVSALAVLPTGDLAAGGEFTMAGGAVSACFAQWTEHAPPNITQQPAPRMTGPTGTAPFAMATTQTAAISYQWQVQAVPGVWMDLGPSPAALPCGGVAAAFATPSNSPTVTIGIIPCPSATPDDPQHFQIRCVATNDCGSSASSEAIYTVCPADFNGSGMSSVQDLFDFLAAFYALDPRADINGSGLISVQDIFDFLAAYFAGCA
jgi:hypothetical protein